MAEMNILTEDFGRMGLEKREEVDVKEDEPVELVNSDDYVKIKRSLNNVNVKKRDLSSLKRVSPSYSLIQTGN